MRKNGSWLFAFVVLTLLSASLAWAGGQTAAPAAEAKKATYPTQPIQFLIPFGVGGDCDLLGRALATATEKILGQPIVPINKTGAGGGIMHTTLKDAAPDGYTLGWSSTSVLTSTAIGNVPFQWDSFEHVARIGYTSMPIAVLATSEFRTAQDLANYARQNPGKIKIGNAGTGSGTHLTAVIFAQAAGIDVVHVPLGAERRLSSLLGGEVQAVCVPLPEIAPQVLDGAARILGIPSEQREPKFPDVPTMREQGLDVVLDLFRHVAAPKGTPPEVLAILTDAFQKAVQDDAFKTLSEKYGFMVSYQTGPALMKYLEDQNRQVVAAMKATGMAP